MAYILKFPDSTGPPELPRVNSGPIMGPGAPHDRTWREVTRAMSLNQGIGLPSETTFHLPQLKMLFSLHAKDPYMDGSESGYTNGSQYYSMWYKMVPRPLVDDPNAEKWYNMSQGLVGYLIYSLGRPALVLKVMEMNPQPVFADEFVVAVKTCLLCRCG